MKTVDEIYQEMLTAFESETGYDMENSADLAVRLKAAAAQVYSLYVYSDWAARMAFPQTAEGAYLDRHAQMRGLARKSAAKAEGSIRFYIGTVLSYDLTVAAGTVCRTAGQVDFITTQVGTIAAGQLYADIPAEAVDTGVVGNVRSGIIVTMPLPPAGVQGCTNPSAFTGGADGETDLELRSRVMDSFARLPNGANAAFYENLVLEDSGVCAVNVLPRYGGIGTVGIAVTPAEGVDGNALIARLTAMLNEKREIVVDVTVFQPEQVTVNITAALQPMEGYSFETVSAAAQSAIAAYFDGTLIGKSFLKKHLYGILNGVEGLANYSVTLPANDIFVDGDQIPIAGSVSLTRV